MLPDNKDALKAWLVETLNPICEADPDTLANYVLALIKKKDKSEDDLIELCKKDLEVFLRSHTKGFVDRLFEALRSKDYLFETDKCVSNAPQASQKLASSPTSRRDRLDQNMHLTSYKSLPKRDQEQIRPKECDQMKSRRQERHADVDSRDKWRHDRRHSKSPQTRNRLDFSRERMRKKAPQLRGRGIEQSPRDVTSPPLRLGKRSYTRSLSKSVDPHDLEQEHARHSSKESSRSISPEGINKSKRNRSRSSSKERGDGGKKQRCRMYYEQGYCEFGDKCPYDHGKNPVLISNRELSLQNSFDFAQSTFLRQSQVSSGGPTLIHHPHHHHHQAVIPNVSQPPPALPFPPHRLPPPHFVQQPGGALLLTQPPMRPLMPFSMPPTHRPPPTMYPFLHVATGDLQQDVYQPVEPYMPQPYSSKTSQFNLPPPPIQDQKTSMKGGWKEEEGELEGSVAPSRHVSNLVHVSIDEGKEGDDKTDSGVAADQQYEVATSEEKNVPSYTPTPSSVLMERKRTAKMAGLEMPVVAPNAFSVMMHSDSTMAEDAKLMPPPSSFVKKAAMEHPGERHLPLLGVAGRNQSATNTTLELRKIPREDNTIANINDHFSKFGIIVNLQVIWDNDPCAALVSYASAAQASAAYRSKEPFLNNRFIKIFWHNPEKTQQQGNASQANADSRSMEKESKPKPKYTIPQRHQLQLNRIKKQEDSKKPEGDGSDIKTDVEPSGSNQDLQQDAQKGGPSTNPEAPDRVVIPPRSALKLQRKPAKELQKAGAMKELELRQKKQDLLKKLVETQKNLIELHAKTKNSEEKTKYSQMLKVNDAKIKELNEELKKPMAANPAAAAATDAYKKSFPAFKSKYSKSNKLVRSSSNSESNLNSSSEQLEKQHEQKTILDGELDMMVNSNKEADVLKKKISDIKNVINNITKSEDLHREDASTFGKFNFSQGSTKTGRSFAKVSRSVDRRPRQILITGFPASEDKSALLNHMKNFGQVERSLYDEKTPFFLVTYKYRSDAERAMKDGVTYGDLKLKLIWHNSEHQQKQTNQPSVQSSMASSSSSFSSSSSSTHIHLGIGEERGGRALANSESHSTAEDEEEGAEATSTGLDAYVEDELNEYRSWGLEADEDALLSYEEEDEEEDDDEGVRPWRRR